MTQKIVSLDDLTKLADSEELSEKYVRYISGIGKERTYRHREIADIKILLSLLEIGADDKDGFIFGYTVPQLSKEFDLLKVTDDCCIDIELKSGVVDAEKIEKQLIQNRHYLNMLNRSLFLFTFVSSSRTLYTLRGDDVAECDISELSGVLSGSVGVKVDLDEFFTPGNILVSPLNSPDRFLENKYLLTEHQTAFKREIIKYIETADGARFIGLTGGPGTGKTLLIYDLARELEAKYRVLLVHCGILCDGHNYLNERLRNTEIVDAKELRSDEIGDRDIVIVDEAHRIYGGAFDKIREWTEATNNICIFSYDDGQKLSIAENRRSIAEKVAELCGAHVYKLTNKIRTNKELALFITCLKDISKFRPEYRFDNVRILFEPDKERAVELAARLSEREGYTYISYTPSAYDHRLDRQASRYNTHNVIGQEFDKVCMILDDNFYYDGNRLCGKTHPNPDYIFEKLLYQGLTRVRSALAIVVTEESSLEKVLTMF